MNHTPIPYLVRHSSCAETLVVLPPVRARPGRFIARVYGMDPEQRRVDAEFIVRACNTHDALVKVVLGMLADTPGSMSDDFVAARKLMKAILK